MIILPDFADPSFVSHAFFTRQGGVSAGLYGSLNCGPGSRDVPENVIENRARAARKFGMPAHALLTLRQEHTADVVTVTKGWSHEEMPVADGMVTCVPGLMLGILTADCAPVLFAAPAAGVIGAAHAGWKGAIGGVLEATLEAMEALGAARSDIRAAIGPCIAQPSYEVGAEFREAFVRERAENDEFFLPSDRADHFLFDLAGYVSFRLASAGVKNVLAAGVDTFQDNERFFSYRRTTKRGEADYGRHLSALALV